MSLGHTQSDPLLSYVFLLTFQTFYAGYGEPISCTSTMANQLCLLRPLRWFAPAPACLPQHALFPSTERTPLARSSLVAASTGEAHRDNKNAMKNVYGKSVCVCVCARAPCGVTGLPSSASPGGGKGNTRQIWRVPGK